MYLDYDQACAAIRSYLEANFTALPITWGNDNFDPAASGPNGWVYVRIALTHGEQVAMCQIGQGLFRDHGACHVWVYVPRGSKVGLAESTATAIRKLFADQPIDGIIFGQRAIGAGGVDGANGMWWGVPVAINWWADRVE